MQNQKNLRNFSVLGILFLSLSFSFVRTEAKELGLPLPWPDALKTGILPNLPLPVDPSLPIELVEPVIRTLYTPLGFDNNDIAQFVVEGQFPNNCYRALPAQVFVEHATRRVLFQIYAYHYKGDCPEPEKTAWFQVIDTPVVLKSGNYEILRVTKDLKDPEPKLLGHFEIAHTDSKRRDDFLYAPVDSFFLKTPRGEGDREIVLTGTYPNNCTVLDRKLTHMHPSEDILIVQPVTKRSDEKECEEIPTAFFEPLVIPSSLSHGRYLFHIRTKDGNSFNKIQYLSVGK